MLLVVAFAQEVLDLVVHDHEFCGVHTLQVVDQQGTQLVVWLGKLVAGASSISPLVSEVVNLTDSKVLSPL